MFATQTVYAIDICCCWHTIDVMNDAVRPPRKSGARDSFYCEVGARIREFRRKISMKQDTLAGAVALTRTSLTNIEKGRQRLLLHTFVRIAAELNVEPNALLPTGTAMLEKLGIELPDSMNSEIRDFIARAVGPKVTNDTHENSLLSSKSERIAPRKRNSQRSG
jgi:DNA-binding XRE family transcriptional regulator